MVMCDLLCCVSVLERLQRFLPQMAEANEKLKQDMAKAPSESFDIESVDEADKVIEMVSVRSLLNVSVPTFLPTLNQKTQLYV